MEKQSKSTSPSIVSHETEIPSAQKSKIFQPSLLLTEAPKFPKKLDATEKTELNPQYGVDRKMKSSGMAFFDGTKVNLICNGCDKWLGHTKNYFFGLDLILGGTDYAIPLTDVNLSKRLVDVQLDARRPFDKDLRLASLYIDSTNFGEDWLRCRKCDTVFMVRAFEEKRSQGNDILILNMKMVRLHQYNWTSIDLAHQTFEQCSSLSGVRNPAHAKAVLKTQFGDKGHSRDDHKSEHTGAVSVACKDCQSILGTTENTFFFLGESCPNSGYIVPKEKFSIQKQSMEIKQYHLKPGKFDSDLIEWGWVDGIEAIRENDYKCRKCDKKVAVQTTKVGGVRGVARILAFDISAICLKDPTHSKDSKHYLKARRVDITASQECQRIKQFLDLPDNFDEREEREKKNVPCQPDIGQDNSKPISNFTPTFDMPLPKGDPGKMNNQSDELDAESDNNGKNVQPEAMQPPADRNVNEHTMTANDWKDAYRTLSITLAELRAERERTASLEQELKQLKAAQGVAPPGGKLGFSF